MTLPGLTVEVALSKGPNDTVSGGDWTDFSDRVLEFSMRRGREDRTAEFESGTVSLILDNSDDMLDPLHYGSLVELDSNLGLPLCPIRIQGNYGGVDYDLFYGFIGPECWTVDRRRVDYGSTVRLDAIDRVGLFAQIGLPSSLFAAQVQWLQPSWWVRGLGGDVAAGNGDDLRDSSGNAVAGKVAASGSDVIFETASLVDGETDSAMAHQVGVSGYTDDATLIAARGDLTMACVWKGGVIASDQEIMRQRNMSSTHVRWRVECQVGGAIVATIYNSSGTPTDYIAAPANPDGGRWDDGQPHIIFLRVEGGSRMRIWVDGQRDECTASIPATTAGRIIFGGGTRVAYFDEVAYWDSALPTLDINTITDAFTGVAPFSGDTVEDRLNRWLTLAGASAGTLTVDVDATPDTLLGVTTMPSTLAEAFTATMESFRGNWLALRNGDIRVRDMQAATRVVADDYYRDPKISLADSGSFDATPDVDGFIRIPRSRPEFFGTRLDRVVNVSRVTWSGIAFALRNDASIARYGERVREWTSDMTNALDAALLADDEVNGTYAYDAPSLEVKPVTIWPLVDDGAGYAAFRMLELERGIELAWSGADGSSYRVDLNMQSESWSWSKGTGCEVEMALASSLGSPTVAVTAAPGSQSFAYTGAVQTFTVPPGHSSVDVTLNGAAGGTSDVPNLGGYGAQVTTTLSVTPGETLNIYVGGRGLDSSVSAGTALPGGWNGGGDGSTHPSVGGRGGPSGGGASDIRRGTTLADRLAVAGGGGGGGDDSDLGGNAGQLGSNGGGAASRGGGYGGTASAGGAGGTPVSGTAGSTGALGAGGAGGVVSDFRGAGGGGGYYGGGGGAASISSSNRGGGGGGSSYSSGTGTTYATAAAGNGSITISWS